MKRRFSLETLEDRTLLTGAMQIAGVATLPGEGQCTEVPEAPDGTELAVTLKMEGDLSGCFYSFVASARILSQRDVPGARNRHLCWLG